MLHEIGPEDALPLLAHASGRQAEFILDQEVWQKDRIDLDITARWLQLMVAADADRFRKWLMREKTDLLEYFLHAAVVVVIREHDQDPSDFGEGFTSFDNVFYFKIIPPPTDEDTSGNAETESKRKTLVHRLLSEMADEDHVLYQKILLEAVHLLPAEAEEDAYRWRNVRLSEKGFLPFEEAVGIYQPPTAAQIQTQRRAAPYAAKGEERVMAVPASPIDLLKKERLYSEALAVLDREAEQRQFSEEFAVLCNRIIVADQALVKNRKDLSTVVKKACGYINIGLEKLSREKEKTAISALIRQYPVAALFSYGFGCALSLKWKAEKWLDKSWFKENGMGLGFWGETWLGIIGGVLIKKPLFHDTRLSDSLYREFETLAEIENTRAALTDIITFDRMLSLVAVSPPKEKRNRPQQGFISYKNFILTLWARAFLNLPESAVPIPRRDFEPFYQALWDRTKAPAKIVQTMKTAFLKWLADKTGMAPEKISEDLGHVLEDLFNEVETEYGPVAYGNLDPRFVHHFLLV